jgi:hypothetical protein
MVLILVFWCFVLDEKECNSLTCHGRNLAKNISLMANVTQWMGSTGAALCCESCDFQKSISAH